MLKRILTVFILIGLIGPANAIGEVKMGPDGLHIQDWFYESSGDLSKDLQAASDQGKNIIVLVEQIGCIYCKKLHEINFEKQETVDMLNENYLVIQLDMWSENQIIDFDGEKLTEEELVRKWDAATTPTTLVLNAANPVASSLAEVEVFRLPGYLEPFQYHTALMYFASGAFENSTFGEYMAVSAAAFAEKGIDLETW